jgi:predicted nuclease of predicted toxin-antitoxin system
MRDHDVVWIRTEAPGSTDIEVLQRAQREERILLTFDKDFGELAFHQNVGPASGIILLRSGRLQPRKVAEMIAATLGLRNDWAGHFSVIEEDRIRMVPLS